MTTEGVEVRFLKDGGQDAATIATDLTRFLSSAERTIDVAIYDFEARAGATARVADALEAALTRGVAVRVAFNVERPSRASAPRPPIAPPEQIEGLEVPTKGVHGDGALMHHKYAIVDGRRVWTGSTNWTNDAFSREENAIVTLDSSAVAAGYTANFEQLWTKERVEASGGGASSAGIEGVTIAPSFSPRGPSLAHVVAEAIGSARRRLRFLSPVLTAGSILGTLAEAAGKQGFDLVGVYDLTQMEGVMSEWERVPANSWKIGAWKAIAPRLSGKRSTPYGQGSVHDYMHAKAVVADDRVVTGSYNCSKGGEENAENILDIEDASIADRFASFAEETATRYRDDR